MDPLAIVLALALGLVIGFVVGARRAFNLMLSGRSVRTTKARVARFMPEGMPARSPEDILAGRVRVTLGGTTHNLPVLPRGPSKRWLEQLDARFATLAMSLDAAADTPAILGLLVSETDALYDLLLSYDQSGVLPSRAEIDETATDAQILQAVLEVWRAVHPLVASVVEAASLTRGPSSGRPTSSLASTAGDPTSSMPA